MLLRPEEGPRYTPRTKRQPPSQEGKSTVPQPPPPEPRPAPDATQRAAFRRAARLTSTVGLVFAVCYLAFMLALAQAPHFEAPDDQIVAFYESQSTGHLWLRLGSLYLLPLAAIAFLWFVAALHAWVELSGRPVDRLMSTLQMLGGVSFVTLALASAAAATVASFANDQYVINPDLARQFPLFGRTLLMVFGMRMAALFVMSTAKLGSSSGLFPTWFLAVSVMVALVLFASASVNIWLTLIFPLWVGLLCLMIWSRRSTHATQPDLPQAA